MLLKSACAALAAAAAIIAVPSGSEAGTRLNLFFGPAYEPDPLYYYPGPLVAPRPRYYYYYDDEDDFVEEPDYYEPEYVPPRKKRLRTVNRSVDEPVAPRKRALKKKPVEAAAPKKQKTKAAAAKKPAVDNVKTASIDKAPAPDKPKGKLIACSKASTIVADYGFSDVKSTDCQGQSYAFTARRDGKLYVIKLSAVSGELTEVAKQ